jgi:hypothetical protein
LKERIAELLAAGGGKFDDTTDTYGFTWLVRRTDPDDLPGLITDLHAINSSLADAGFGAALLCTLIAFTDGQAPPVGLVYLYTRGAWYPFAPAGKRRRDNARELQIQAVLGSDLRLEPDLARWFPVWGAPGL